MRFAAIADIHGNALALEAVLADIRARAIESIVNLGDHFSGPLEAGRTADILAGLDLPTIRGNHDRWLVEIDPADMGPSDRAAHDQLGAAHFDWLMSLPPTMVHEGEVFLCHGTPASDTAYWLETVTPDAAVRLTALEDIERAAAGIDHPLILCAHTHYPRAVRLRDGRMVVNPGSVGCPAYEARSPVPHVMQAGSPLASYAVLEKRQDAWQVEFRLVAYDHMEMAALAVRNGRPDWASALATGWIR